MTRDARRRHEILENERWLAGVWLDTEEIDPEAVKRRVRIALQEQWLTNRVIDKTPEGLAERSKGRVREVLSAVRTSRDGQMAGQSSIAEAVAGGHHRAGAAEYWRLGGVALATAACLAVAAGLAWLSPEREELPWTSAFERFSGDELGEALVELEDDVRALEYSFEASSFELGEEAAIESLYDSIDTFSFDESFVDDDWQQESLGDADAMRSPGTRSTHHELATT